MTIKIYWAVNIDCVRFERVSYTMRLLILPSRYEGVFLYSMKIIDHRGNATIYTDSIVQYSIICNWQYTTQCQAENWRQKHGMRHEWCRELMERTVNQLHSSLYILFRQQSATQTTNLHIQYCTICWELVITVTATGKDSNSTLLLLCY